MTSFYKVFVFIFCFYWHSGYSYDKTPHPKHEFRAIWIATVVNIDWPSEDSLSTEVQKKEFIDILDFYKKLHFNAVIVQVRTTGDAFYPSSYEPWSKYLTGSQGESPMPYYDPLAWMITQAHARGFEFHAWFNPYRAAFEKDTTTLAPNHAFNAHRDWMIKYGNRYYFNPGLLEVVKYTTDVIMEVVNNYAIDAIHFDDYFYPYKIKGEPFDDKFSFENNNRGIEGIDDWRRDNVDILIKTISDSIRSIKPWVQFGISPFGVWRNASTDPQGSDTGALQTTYDDLYADPIKWMNEKWIDYVVPQLYWSMDHSLASHQKLVNWWSNQPFDGYLYIGHGLYKVKNNADKAWNKLDEIPNQIDLTRAKATVNGSVFFSARSIRGKHGRLVKIMRKKKYRYQALPPPSPFLSSSNRQAPVVQKIESGDSQIKVFFEARSDQGLRYIICYGAKKNKSLDLNDPSFFLYKKHIDGKTDNSILLEERKVKKLGQLAFTFLDKYGYESEPKRMEARRVNGKLIIQ